MDGATGTGATYVEKLTPSPGIWAGAWAFSLALGLIVYAVFGPVLAVAAALIPAAALSVLLSRSATEITVAGGMLTVGRAHIPVSALGPARALDAEESRLVRGPESDPAGFHVIRGWLPAGVRAEVVDAGDPTPYWFVASRHPQELASAIEQARSVSGR